MNILFVVAHQDDEALGAGASIHKWAHGDNSIFVLTLSDNAPTRLGENLTSLQKKSSRILGVRRNLSYNLSALKFRNSYRFDVVKKIESAIMEFEPDWVFTHNPTDLHDDHRFTAEVVHEAARLPQRQLGYNKRIKGLAYFEVPTATDWEYESKFVPNAFSQVAISDMKAKIASIKVYNNVVRKAPHPRNDSSLLALAVMRGAQAGSEYAEAFHIAYSYLAIEG